MTDSNLPIEELSRRIAGVESPFALIGLETNFGPDDWAWQFLRLNRSYQRDYAIALAAHDPANNRPPGALSITRDHPERKIRVSEHLCRARYGLSTWLDPQEHRLPHLSRGESWFYPLSRTLDTPEDSRLQVAIEDIFAYSKLPFLGRYDRKRAQQAVIEVHSYFRPDVWFAIDCSVPPSAQMKSVEIVIRIYRDCLHDMNAVVKRQYDDAWRFVPLKECSWFLAETFDTASAVADGVDPSSVWYAIRVDALGPIKEQVKEHLSKLNATYLDLLKRKSAVEPVRKRFRKELKGPRDDDGEQLSDGNFLKALVVGAQLAQQGLDERQTVEFITKHAAKSGKEPPEERSARDKWNLNFVERAKNYREDARAFVKGGYRWLVHAQKP